MSKAADLAALIGSQSSLSNRNLIINGAMQVAQRGTSFTGITDQYTLDRWTSSSAGGVSLNVSQQTATSSDNAHFASKHFARYQRNAVLSGFVHKVENLQQFNNKTFTLSFWAKSSDAGTNVVLTTYTVNDGSSFNSYVTQTYVTNPTLSSTWQKYEMRLTFQDMYSYGYSGSHHLRLQFFDGANAATFDIAEVQLEVGEQATPFEHRSFGDELARCQRYYYQTTYSGSGDTTLLSGTVASAALAAQCGGSFPVTMRSAPTAGYNGSITAYDGSQNPAITSLSANYSSTTNASVNTAVASGLTLGRAVQILSNSSDDYMTFDAEL